MRINPSITLLTGVLAVSTGAVFARAADAPALTIAAYRVGLASLVLVPVAIWTARDELSSLSAKDLLTAMLSGLFLALHFATWISSLDYTTIANSVVLVNTNPLWVGILTPLIAKEKIKPVAVVGIVVSVAGGFVIGWGDFSSGSDALYGDFLALLGSVCAAFYLLLGRNLRKKLSLISYITVCYASAAVILWVMVLSLGLQFTGFSGGTVAAFWAMALITQLVGHTSYNYALRWFSASAIAVSLLGEPIGATVLAWLIFGETVGPADAVGGALILSAIYLVASGEKKDRVDSAPVARNAA